MKIIYTSVILFAAIFLGTTSCYYDSEEYLFPVLTQCDTLNITFSGSVAPVLATSCLSCHSNSTAAAFGGSIALEDYADVKARADDHRLLGSINHEPGYSPMPVGASKLDDCSISLVRIWIESGAPND